MEVKGGPDGVRVKAKRLRLGVVSNDRVSSPGRDRTDWKYVELPKPGKFTVQLHWDSGRAKLTLAVFDVIGVRIQQGRPWGAGGRRAVIAVEEPGRYYIRVQAAGKRDESHYSLRTRFKPEGAGTSVCHPCVVGDRKCLGQSQFMVCEQISSRCNAWAKAVPCPAGTPCKSGVCGKCTPECAKGSRRCSGRNQYQYCTSSPAGCPVWSAPNRCRTKCRRGACVSGKRIPLARPPVKPKKSTCANGKIISMYIYRGRMTLHIEIGDNKKIKPGQLGYVLAGSSEKRLPGGNIKVLRLVGARYVIATTSLKQLGRNRQVCIKTAP